MKTPRSLSEAMRQGYCHLVGGTDVKVDADTGTVSGKICLLRLDENRVILGAAYLSFAGECTVEDDGAPVTGLVN